jgi:uncharacterized repeat protein (TIGR01451 family)
MSLPHLFAKPFRLFLVLVLLTGMALVAIPLPRALAAPIAYSVRSDVNDQLYQIDLATGIATAIGPVGFTDVEGLSFDCAGNLFGVDDVTDQLISINPATGAGTAVGLLGIGGVGIENDFGLAFDFAGNARLSTDAPANFYSVNPATGAATLVGAQGQAVTGLAINAAGVIFGLGGDLTNNLVTINPATGAATVVGPLGGAVSLLLDGGLNFDAGGTLWALGDPTPGTGNPGQIFTINIVTGAATLVATPTVGGLAAGGFEGLAINTTCAATPTPTPTNTSGPSPTPLPTNTPAPPPPTNTPAPTSPPPAIVDPYLTKAADPQFAQVGDIVQFTMIVTNPNAVELANFVLVDQLPPQFDFMNATTTQGSFTFDAGSNTATFNLGTVAAGQSATMTIQARVNDKAQPGDVLRNVAVLNVDGRMRGQAEASVEVIPSTIPATGIGPGWRELAATSVLALLALLSPVAAWRLARRSRRKND